MRNEYFSTLSEALAVFTSEQRARDFQEFIIAISFCRKFDAKTHTGGLEVVKAIEEFQSFLQPLNAVAVNGETHAKIREQASKLSEILK